jgi:LysR family transcriptional regulator, hydrogen peroxide-inducible genes activator
MSSSHTFSLRQLQYLVAVADTLNFRRAAERCHVAQPSLSAQLAELESAIGVRVFERDRRRVLVTRAGRDLVAHARRVLADASDFREAARRVSDPLSASLRIGVIPTISPYLLPGVAPSIHCVFPRLAIQWVEEKTSVLMDALNQGALDAALVALEADIGKVEQSVVATDSFVLATPADHPLGSREWDVSADELHNVGVLLLDDGHCFREQALAYCSGAGAQELEFRATSLSTLVQMVASGRGLTLLPELSVATESKRADLRIRKFAKPSPHRTIGLVWRKGSPAVNSALRRLAEAIRSAHPKNGAPAGRR